MKNNILILTLVFTIFIGFSQEKNKNIYKRIYKYDIYQKDWAKVKNITGNYGIINQNGKEIVPTIYTKIGNFDAIEKDLALVKSVSGFFGFIDRNGKEVVPTIYSRKQIKSNYYKIEMNKL